MVLLIVAFLALLVLGKKKDGSQYGTVDADGGFTPPPKIGPQTDPKTGQTTIYPTISEGGAQAIAEEIYSELDSFFISDDNIAAKFFGLNEADYLRIYKAFGKRGLHLAEYFGINQHDLTYFIINTFDEGNMKDMRTRFPHIFAAH
jgi:hypothetical protein